MAAPEHQAAFDRASAAMGATSRQLITELTHFYGGERAQRTANVAVLDDDLARIETLAADLLNKTRAVRRVFDYAREGTGA